MFSGTWFLDGQQRLLDFRHQRWHVRQYDLMAGLEEQEDDLFNGASSSFLECEGISTCLYPIVCCPLSYLFLCFKNVRLVVYHHQAAFLLEQKVNKPF